MVENPNKIILSGGALIDQHFTDALVALLEYHLRDLAPTSVQLEQRVHGKITLERQIAVGQG
jgi:hypothetical protein